MWLWSLASMRLALWHFSICHHQSFSVKVVFVLSFLLLISRCVSSSAFAGWRLLSQHTSKQWHKMPFWWVIEFSAAGLKKLLRRRSEKRISLNFRCFSVPALNLLSLQNKDKIILKVKIKSKSKSWYRKQEVFLFLFSFTQKCEIFKCRKLSL